MIIQMVHRVAAVNCQVNPPTIDHGTVIRNQGQFQNDHWILGNNQQFGIECDLAAPLQQIEVRIRGLVSRLNPNPGFSPIALLVNGQPVVTDYTMPGEGYQPHTASFHVPVKLLKEGKNQFILQVSGQARSFFWLYGMEVLVLDDFSCNLTVDPPVTEAGLTLIRKAGMFQNDHLRCDRGDGVTLALHMPKPQTDHAGLVIGVFGLVSRAGEHDGFSPVDILMNDKVIAARQEIEPGGWQPQLAEFFVPADAVKEGDNTVALRVCQDAKTVFWLYEMTLVPVGYGA